jgi:hypothetical protein
MTKKYRNPNVETTLYVHHTLNMLEVLHSFVDSGSHTNVM